ncbi:hypothetical protein DFH08DRAFT_840119 [Mycena albidolilacea]|uniref:Uncharacterized protein n=1 Tax=Mycena albidolilacea TaxID=1033008 RepID=A0AAD7F4S0_9AGAR|nr:hypothetical protein DFH08DRAFT_840119 [Mycena albidolilacea]
MSGEPYLFGSLPPGTLSGLPILNEKRPVHFPALIQNVTTSPGRADFTPIATLVRGDPSLSGNLSSGTFSGLPILDEPELDHLSALIQSRNLATTSPGRADYIPIASLYDDPSLWASFFTSTFSGLPIRNQDGSNHFSALIQSQSPGSDLVATSAQRGEDFIPIVPCAADPVSFGTEPSRFPNVTLKPDASRRRKALNRDTPSRGGCATRKPKKVNHEPYTIFHHEHPGSSKMGVPSKRRLLSNSTAHPWKGRKKEVPDEFGFVEPFTVPDPAINNDPKAIIWTSETTSVGTGHSQYGVPPPYAVFPPSDQSP